MQSPDGELKQRTCLGEGLLSPSCRKKVKGYRGDRFCVPCQVVRVDMFSAHVQSGGGFTTGFQQRHWSANHLGKGEGKL